jgi:MFS transporter, DHA1 family, inner membrane transport protein
MASSSTGSSDTASQRGISPAGSDRAPGNTGMGRVAILAVGTFAVGTDAFVVAGVLGDVSRSLQVSVAQAGQLVTVFALAYAVLSPVLAALTGTWTRRQVLLTALGVFVLGNVLTAVAPTFGLVLASRVVAAAGATMVTPTSSVVAASLVPAEKRARAIAIATSGLTTATALGAPLGTAVAIGLGWRGTMWFVAALGVVAAVVIAVRLPNVPNPPVASLRQRLSPVTDRRVLGILLTTLVMFTGIYIVYTYISVIFEGATGGDGGTLSLLLFVFGVAATVGNFLAGYLADRIGPRAVVALAGVVLIVISLLSQAGGSTLPTAFVTIAVYGLAAFSVTAPQQHRLMTTRPDSASLVVAINAAFLYLAVSLAGGIGGLLINSVGGAWLGVAAAASVLLGLVLSEFAHHDAQGKVPARQRTQPESTS